MQKYWNKYVEEPWVFVYKPGAGGIIGFTEIAKATPDGYTIGGLNVPHIVLQSLAQRAAFNAESFDYIAQVVNDPQCVAVLKSSKYKSFQEIIDDAKVHPNKVKIGLVGPLSGHHLMFLEFNKLYPDVKLSRVFYKGAADQNAALLGGEVDLIFGNINDVMVKLHQRDLDSVAKTRAAIGDGIDLALDVNGCWTRREAVRMAHDMEQYNLRWLEEPLNPMDDYDGLRFVRERSNISIAAGENEYTHYGFKTLIEKDAVDILQPDVIKAGGLSCCRKILAMKMGPTTQF